MEKRRCIFCMAEMDAEEQRCPVCGKALWQYQWEAKWLRPYTKLKERYLIGAVLGEGAFGVTYLAYDEMENIPVAVKSYFRQESKQEADILQKAASIPGVVKEKEFFLEGDAGYLVMEYLEGGSLKAYLKKRHTVQAKEAVKLLLPVMKAAALLHARGIVHCDISPDNLLFDREGQLTLIDFGAAMQKGRKREEKELKEGYAPVEQYQEKNKIGPWTDLYALCAVWYEAVTGHKVPAAPGRLKKDTLRPPGEYVKVAGDMEGVFMRGLSVDIQGRYFGVGNLLAGLYMEDEDIKAQTMALRGEWGDLWIQITTEVERTAVAAGKKGRKKRILRMAGDVLLGFALAAGLAAGGLWLYCDTHPEEALAYHVKKDREEAENFERKVIESRDSEEFEDALGFLEENAYENNKDEYISTYRFMEGALEGWEYPSEKAGVFPIKQETLHQALDLYMGMERKGEDKRFNGYVDVYQEEWKPLKIFLKWEERWEYGEDFVSMYWDYATEFVTDLSFASWERERAEDFLHEMLPILSPESYLTEKEIGELFAIAEEEDGYVSIRLNRKCEVSMNRDYENRYSVSISIS